ncbi:hypothetical protein AB0M46_49780 [Dactylosporangium sp. NPDC051485]|uniref:hypothetical protein n=1 Tax=Dactylosporangium sp. NPDC051485 TaxID=3154846 RepID=UPI0034320640
MPADRNGGPRHLRRERRGRHSAVRWHLGLSSACAVIAFAVIGALLLVFSHGGRSQPVAQSGPSAQREDDRVADAERRASRGEQRTGDTPSGQPSASASGGQQPSPAGTAVPAPPNTTTAAPAKPAPAPTVIAPVGGLTQAEMKNAVTIVRTGQEQKLPNRAYVVAIATALQESHLHNLANPNVPESLNLPNEGVGSDHDSVGLFQQRPSWGTVAELMNPAEAARRFYAALVKVDGWEQMAVTVAAQTVQVSAYPDAYAKWQALAEQVVATVAP